MSATGVGLELGDGFAGGGELGDGGEDFAGGVELGENDFGRDFSGADEGSSTPKSLPTSTERYGERPETSFSFPEAVRRFCVSASAILLRFDLEGEPLGDEVARRAAGEMGVFLASFLEAFSARRVFSPSSSCLSSSSMRSFRAAKRAVIFSDCSICFRVTNPDRPAPWGLWSLGGCGPNMTFLRAS